jgi:hypothetical protein
MTSYGDYINNFSKDIANSDLTPSSDEYMYSNAKAMEIYGQGKRFQIEDNTLNYEVVKIVKDIVDRHFYHVQLQFYVQVANKGVVFTFVMDKSDAQYSYFMETLYMFITSQIYKTYGSYFLVSREDEQLENNLISLKIKVKKDEEV